MPLLFAYGKTGFLMTWLKYTHVGNLYEPKKDFDCVRFWRAKSEVFVCY